MDIKERLELLFADVKVARIETIEKHSNADRLQVVTLDGVETQGPIVTGADNFRVGDYVPYLGPGGTVPGVLIDKGEEFVLEARALRGVKSYGMILAEDELGLGSDHKGILIINTENFPKFDDGQHVGKSIWEVLSSDQIAALEQKAEQFQNLLPVVITHEIQAKIDLIMEVGDEVIGADQLARILTSDEALYAYDGFEPSGQMHIAQGVIRAINTNKMIKAGFTFRMYVADWFGYLNNKMGGDLEKIQKVGDYFIEIWRASGMDLENTEFIWTSDVIKDPEYWELVMKIAKSSSLSRILKTTEIMGRNESDDLTAAQILYPAMQVADIFQVMECQVTQLGIDQRKVNMLAREVGPKLGFWKPVVVSHGMLQGLQKPKDKKVELISFADEVKLKVGDYDLALMGMDPLDHNLGFEVVYNSVRNTAVVTAENPVATVSGITLTLKDFDKREIEVAYYEDVQEARVSMKMSKSKPDTAIFMTDTRADIERKIRKAWCPEKTINENPILEYCKHIIFEAHHLKLSEPLLTDGKFEIKRAAEFGGDVSYSSYAELETDFGAGNLFPLDLKNAVVEYLDRLLQPVRDHFQHNEKAKQLLAEVQSFEVTR